MANEPKRWVFTADEAVEAARLVVHRDPTSSRTHILIPADQEAAAAGVTELAVQLRSLPASIRSALEGAESSAGHLSDDRLQGLAELIQNADDLGASNAVFAVDEAGSRLLFRHNGDGLTLHDVWGLAIPWLSLKVTDAEQLGRFGIGLKTLHSLSDILEAHEGQFHVRFEAQVISIPNTPELWPGRNTAESTTFVVPFEPGAVTTADVATWLARWGDAGLVFLRNVHTVTLDEGDATIARLHVDRDEAVDACLADTATLRRRVTATDGRTWVTYTRRVPAPVGKRRARKAQAERTPVGVAFPQFDGDSGHLHVGLPVRPIGVPFRIFAQFDPLASRRDISDTEWNHAVIAPVSVLWHDAVLDQFRLNPELAWSLVPLVSELDVDDRTTGKLRAALDVHLLTAARLAFADALTLDDGEPLHLADLSYEAPELTAVLTPEDVRLVADTVGTVTTHVRSNDERWRLVLDDLAELGAKTPVVVDVTDALSLLEDTDRPIEFVADLTAVAVDSGLTTKLRDTPCLALDDGSRVTPNDVTGLRVLLPENAGPLWDALATGSRLHGAYRDRDGWKTIRDWLRDANLLLRDASDLVALRVLADAGEDDAELPQPLSDTQANTLRAALENVPAGNRPNLGAGIGHAIRLDATTYDNSGNRVPSHARPCDAYFIEREANTWSVAAGKTPGLVWLHRRYGDTLRAASPREGIGAQRLFRLLGAETAPRLIEHPANQKTYVYYPPAVSRFVAGSPSIRDLQLQQHEASHTVRDQSSPDLDAVLTSIAAEKNRTERVRRAAALLNSLSKAWDRLEPHARVKAAVGHHKWVTRGEVDAWWLASAASIPWLTASNGTPTAPDDLRVKTVATLALFGDDLGQYLAEQLDAVAYSDVLTALGVQGAPRPDEILDKLREIRDETPDDAKKAADLAAPLYTALSAQAQVHGNVDRRVGSMTASRARAAFSKGPGLVATNLGWRRPSVVLSGPAVFGDMRAFVPSVTGTNTLWSLLDIRPPKHTDATDVLRQLSRKKTLPKSHELVMLEALRFLAGTPVHQLPRLRRSAVWVGDRWITTRPVYAVANPLIAVGLASSIPIWSPGGTLAPLESLIEPYDLTRLDGSHASVINLEEATYDPERTRVFSAAVANLREDLALSDPDAEQSLTLSWNDLTEFKVCVLSGLIVQLTEPARGTVLPFAPGAWMDADTSTLYVADAETAGRPESGAYAVASVFTSDARRISHDWVVAWARAEAGVRAETVTTAASLDAEQKRIREAESEERLREVAARPKKRPTKSKGRNASGTDTFSGAAGGNVSKLKSPPPRQLIDLDGLTLRNENGEIVIGGTGEPMQPGGVAGESGEAGKLRDPDPSRPKKTGTVGRRPPQNYTAEDRETLGLALAKWVLGLDDERVVDIRNQHNVGADAVDHLRNFYELKVYSGPIPDVVQLEDSQVQRALSTEDFFLIAVGNVEGGRGKPEIRIITDPLDHLQVQPAGSVKLGGVLSAKALKYTFDQ